MEGTPFGHYRLIELFGRGGMGQVWRAHDTEADRIVAIKVLPAHLSEDKEFQKRFRREAHAAARLNSPHVIPIHRYGEIDGRLYLDMRLIDGRDLATVLANGPLDPTRAVNIVGQVAKALRAAHEVGLLHRDIKPSNILLDRDDFAYLIDFGIARMQDETRMTKSGSVIGTYLYIAPERLTLGADEDARADIYSLACVLYECLTGSPPFPGETMSQLVGAHLYASAPRPSMSQPQVPLAVDDVIARGMAKHPDDRYATTVELADAARDAITQHVPLPVPAPPSDLPGQAESNPGDASAGPPPPTTTSPDERLAPTPTVAAISKPLDPVAKAGDREPVVSPRAPRRRIIAGSGVAAAIVAIVVVAALIGLDRGSTATPAARITSTTPRPMVGPDRMDSILLSAMEVATVMGVSDMPKVGAIAHVPFDPPDEVSNSDCLGTVFIGEKPVYAGSGYTAMSLQVLADSETVSRFVQQGVVHFPSAEKALSFIKNSATKWRTCAGQTVTWTSGGGQFRWAIGDLAGDASTIAQPKTLTGDGSICQRVLSAVSNLVIDVNACGPRLSDQARQIASKIAAQAG